MGTRKISLLLGLALVAGLFSSTSAAAPPDLCADRVLGPTGDPYEDSVGRTISKWCEPHTSPPTWGADVCCVITDEANCVAPDEVGRCSIGMKFGCQYGEQIGDGVACYEPGPSACDMGFCSVQSPEPEAEWAAAIWLCCHEDGDWIECTFAGESDNYDIPEVSCSGYLAICNWGQTLLDGTVSCLS